MRFRRYRKGDPERCCDVERWHRFVAVDPGASGYALFCTPDPELDLGFRIEWGRALRLGPKELWRAARRHRPRVLVSEVPFAGKNPQSTLKQARDWGFILGSLAVIMDWEAVNEGWDEPQGIECPASTWQSKVLTLGHRAKRPERKAAAQALAEDLVGQHFLGLSRAEDREGYADALGLACWYMGRRRAAA